MPWAEIVTAWSVFAANILSPGPNVLNTIAIALGAGRRTAMAVVPAIAIGVAVWASASILGAAALFRRVPAAEAGLSALGGVLLLWFALRYAQRAIRWTGDETRGIVTSRRTAFLTALAVMASNPKALTTWLVLVTIFPVGSATPKAIAVMIAGSVAVAALGHLGYAWAFSTRAAARVYARAGRWVLAGISVFFGALGASLLWHATPPLVRAAEGAISGL